MPGWIRTPGTGFPAHAGMDPENLFGSIETATASPHTRGWTRRQLRPADGEVGFPAHAGMDPSPDLSSARLMRLPRTRGDGPDHEVVGGLERSASPHTRGWTRRAAHRQDAGRGFPAHAGMDPGGRRLQGRGRGLPRTRGDGPFHTNPAAFVIGASPHTRGWTPGRGTTRGWTPEPVIESSSMSGFPAHAGMDPPRGA